MGGLRFPHPPGGGGLPARPFGQALGSAFITRRRLRAGAGSARSWTTSAAFIVAGLCGRPPRGYPELALPAFCCCRPRRLAPTAAGSHGGWHPRVGVAARGRPGSPLAFVQQVRGRWRRKGTWAPPPSSCPAPSLASGGAPPLPQPAGRGAKAVYPRCCCPKKVPRGIPTGGL